MSDITTFYCHGCLEDEDGPTLTPAVTTRRCGRWELESPLCRDCAEQYDERAERQALARQEA